MIEDVPVDLRERIVAALRDAGARFALLHGSRAAGTHREDSDTDVAAWWGASAPASFEVSLPSSVDLLVLDSAPLELRGRVAQTGLLLFDDDHRRGCGGSRRRGRSTPTNVSVSSGRTGSSSRGSARVRRRRRPHRARPSRRPDRPPTLSAGRGDLAPRAPTALIRWADRANRASRTGEDPAPGATPAASARTYRA